MRKARTSVLGEITIWCSSCFLLWSQWYTIERRGNQANSYLANKLYSRQSCKCKTDFEWASIATLHHITCVFSAAHSYTLLVVCGSAQSSVHVPLPHTHNQISLKSIKLCGSMQIQKFVITRVGSIIIFYTDWLGEPTWGIKLYKYNYSILYTIDL